MRSVDMRAHGATEKGSLPAQVQSEAAKHAGGAEGQDSTVEAAAAPKSTAADAEAGASIETLEKMDPNTGPSIEALERMEAKAEAAGGA